MDQTTFDRLERLAKLRADGALSDAEYDTEKAKLLATASTASSGSAATHSGQSGATVTEKPIDETSLSSVWRERFRLIDEHGMPTSRPYTEAMRHVGAWERVQYTLSPLAFVFGPLYFLYLGLWRPAISLFGAAFVFGLMFGFLAEILGLPASLDRLSWIVPAAAYAFVCIPLYYLRIRRGIHSWNPLIWWSR